MSVASAAEKIDFTFRYLEMPVAVAHVLEKRLIEGGEAAEQVEAKLPDLLKKRTVVKLESLELQAENAQRKKAGDELWDAQKRQSKSKGWEFEVDPVVGAEGHIELNAAFARHSPLERRRVLYKGMTSAFTMLPNQLMSVRRFDQEGRAQLLLARAVIPGRKDAVADGSGLTNLRTRGDLFRMPSARSAAAVIDLAAWDSEAALAKAKADGELVIGFGDLSRSGQRSQSKQTILPRGDTEVIGNTTFDVECIAAKGRVSATGTISHDVVERGRVSDHVKGTVGKKVLSGEVVIVRCKSDKKAGDSPYVFAMRTTASGAAAVLGEVVKVVPAKPRAAAPGSLYVASYAAPPEFLQALGKRLGLDRPSAKAICEAAGIAFPEGASVFFNPRNSNLMFRNDHAGHVKVAELINSLIE